MTRLSDISISYNLANNYINSSLSLGLSSFTNKRGNLFTICDEAIKTK